MVRKCIKLSGILALGICMASTSLLKADDNVEAKIYGYLHLALAYETAPTHTGNYPVWAKSSGHDSQYFLTANQTRLGLALNGPDFGTGKTRGKLEIDFYGGNTENKPYIGTRHAYIELIWPEIDFSILAGQTWDLVSPLMPATVVYAPLWNAGDIGFRRPQLRLTQDITLGEKTKLTIKAALARTIPTHVNGIHSGAPSAQGSIALSLPLLTEKPMMLGISGHTGKEEINNDTLYDTHALSLDLKLPVTDVVIFKANAWQGTNLATYLGGIGQSIVGTDSVNAKGGWIMFGFGPFGSAKINLGASIDVPQEDQLGAGARTQNGAYFGNVMVNLNPKVVVAAEVSQWRTLYKDAVDGQSTRVQTSIAYKF